MSLRIVVTGGPSYEPIDEVRRITNFSTGSLAAYLSEHLAARGHEVIHLRGTMATAQPPGHPVNVIPFSTNDDLLLKLRSIPAPESIDALLHVAALADFTVRRESTERKLSSRVGEIILTLVPATKVIGQLRSIFPRARIVGWKYELDGTHDDALARGRHQLTENATDACVVNGAAYGPGFGFLSADGKLVHLPGQGELAEHLSRWLEA